MERKGLCFTIKWQAERCGATTWSKTVPIEPGHYWIKLINGGQEIALGELNPLRKKKVVFYFPNTELAHDGDLGDLIVKDGGRFWSERIVPPDIQPAAGLPDH
jgi:hypothetical protein